MNDQISEILGSSASIGLSAILYIILGAGIFLLVSIIAVVICGRKNIFKRKNSVWNVFTKIYYLYIPLVFMIFGGIFGALYSLNKSVNKNIEKQSEALIESIIPEMPEFQEFINENLDSVEIAGYTTEDLVNKFFKKDSVDVEDEGFFSSISSKAGKWVLEGAVDGVIEYTAEELDLDVSTTEGTIKALKSIDFNNLDKSLAKIGSNAIEKQVDKFFRSIMLSQLLNMLIFLAIPIIEIIIYFGFVNKKNSENVIELK